MSTGSIADMMFGLFGLQGFGTAEPPELEVIDRAPEAAIDAPPLLFIHGAYAGAWCWEEHFLDYFAERGYECHAMSLRGHGRSRGRGRLHQWGVADYVNDVERTVASLKRAPVLIGHSMGGLVIQKYLERHTAPGAVLMASVPPSGLTGSAFHMMTGDPLLFAQIALMQTGAAGLIDLKTAGRALFSDDLPLDKLYRLAPKMQEESPRAIFEMTVSHLPRRSRVNRVPMLVLGGESDALFSTEMVRKTARAYDAEVEIFPDMAHAMMLETNWREPADAILEWLKRLKG